MDTDTLYKNRIQQRLAGILLDAFENETLPQANISYLAGYIREEMEHARDSADVFDFVEKLAKDWPMFAVIINEPNVPSWKQDIEDGKKVTLESLAKKPKN